jgi:hypothetical protein
MKPGRVYGLFNGGMEILVGLSLDQAFGLFQFISVKEWIVFIILHMERKN